jgi:phosphoglucosamine mutase
MKYFGTDGIRSKVNSSFLDQNFAVNLGEAVAKFIKSKSSRNNKVFIGRDTRPSGEMLLNGFMQGLKNEDLSGISVGVLPTPALAFCVIKNKGALGVQITASHNPECDNGFKFFLPSGNKLTENEESLIEELISTDKKQLSLKVLTQSMQIHCTFNMY